MNREARWLMYSVIGIGMGAGIFYTSHDAWRIRGLLYMILGAIGVYRYAAKKES